MKKQKKRRLEKRDKRQEGQPSTPEPEMQCQDGCVKAPSGWLMSEHTAHKSEPFGAASTTGLFAQRTPLRVIDSTLSLEQRSVSLTFNNNMEGKRESCLWELLPSKQTHQPREERLHREPHIPNQKFPKGLLITFRHLQSEQLSRHSTMLETLDWAYLKQWCRQTQFVCHLGQKNLDNKTGFNLRVTIGIIVYLQYFYFSFPKEPIYAFKQLIF